MKHKMKKIFENAVWWSGVVMVGLILGISLQFVRAWTEPTQAPPGGNVGAPINTSATAQTKAGNLNVNGGMLIGSSTTGGNKGAGTINADQVCIRGVCNTTWPSGGTPAPAPAPAPGPCVCGDSPCGSTYHTQCSTACFHSNMDFYICTGGAWVLTSSVPCIPNCSLW